MRQLCRCTLLLVCLFIASQAASEGNWVVRDAEIMGTTIHAEVWHARKHIAEQVAEQVMRTMREVDESMSPYIATSELFLINRNAAKEVLSISRNLYTVIERALHYSTLTQGAFDITFASVGYLYDYRNAVGGLTRQRLRCS